MVTQIQRKTTTSKALNGILRKSSLVVEETTQGIPDAPPLEKHLASKSIKDEKDLTSNAQKSKTLNEKRLSNKSNSRKLSKSDTQSDADGLVETDSALVQKSSSKSQLKGDKTGKDLALTRDLPWCGCWGNGCL
jgi:hypothetical protein